MSGVFEQQAKFTLLVAQLIAWAYNQGYQLTFGDAYRNPNFSKERIGDDKSYFHSWSFHCKRLAIDLNLFKDGKYLTKTEDYIPLGNYWKSLDSLCSSGIDFNDGNHVSFGEGK